MSGLLDLPAEVLLTIFDTIVRSSGLSRSLDLRAVCKSFDHRINYILPRINIFTGTRYWAPPFLIAAQLEHQVLTGGSRSSTFAYRIRAAIDYHGIQGDGDGKATSHSRRSAAVKLLSRVAVRHSGKSATSEAHEMVWASLGLDSDDIFGDSFAAAIALADPESLEGLTQSLEQYSEVCAYTEIRLGLGSPMQVAVTLDNVAILQILLSHEAKCVRPHHTEHYQLILTAAFHGNTTAARTLIDATPALNWERKFEVERDRCREVKTSIIRSVVRGGSVELLDTVLLLAHAQNPLCNWLADLIFWHACHYGHEHIAIKALDEYGASTIRSFETYDVLNYARRRYCHANIVGLILRRAASVHKYTFRAWRTAATCGFTRVAQVLLRPPAPPLSDKDGDVQDIVMIAAERGHADFVDLILRQFGASGTTKDHFAMGTAARGGHDAVIRVLVAHGINLESLPGCDPSPMQKAFMAGQRIRVQELLRTGWEPEDDIWADEQFSRDFGQDAMTLD